MVRALSSSITIPFRHLILHHHEIGLHRGRRWGFREVFGLSSLKNMPFIRLAMLVKQAYEGRPPAHEGWPAQREALQWIVDKGRDGIYALDPRQNIRVRRNIGVGYFIDDGHHRALALYILGEASIRATLTQLKTRQA